MYNKFKLPDPPSCKHDGYPAKQYALMMDAGSTGSRIHVYKFNYCNSELPVLEDEVFEQLKPGLSSFASKPTDAADSIVPLLEIAKKHIPEELRSCTPIALKATAGLRLLGNDVADSILRAVEAKIREYPFKLIENGVIVMDGADEGWRPQVCYHQRH
jgi:guanosine-diphosphatase